MQDDAAEARSGRDEVGVAMACLAAEVARLGPAAVVLGVVILLFALGTVVRNSTWADMGALWLDIANKTYRMRILDPATGREAPRQDRARIYNNIGLYLYNQGRDLHRARSAIARTIAEYERIRTDAETPVARRRVAACEEEIVRLYDEIERLRAALIEHIPREFQSEAKRGGVSRDSLGWDLLLPARLSLERALYHNSIYYKAHLNLGLVEKIRAFDFPPDSVEREAYLRRSVERFRVAIAVHPTYEKALRYLADGLLLLEEYGEARRAAIRAVRHHKAHEGQAALFEEIDCIIEASDALGDYDVALDWIDVALQLEPLDPGPYEARRKRLRALQRQRERELEADEEGQALDGGTGRGAADGRQPE